MVVVASAMRRIKLAGSDCRLSGRMVLVSSCCNDGDVGGSNGRLIDRNEKLPCLPFPCRARAFRVTLLAGALTGARQQNHVISREPRDRRQHLLHAPSGSQFTAQANRKSSQTVIGCIAHGDFTIFTHSLCIRTSTSRCKCHIQCIGIAKD